MQSNVSCGKRIFLFSDGLVNEGVTARPDIFEVVKAMQQNGVNITTFGIGSGFDEKVMKGIADEAHGNYFFIGKSDEIPTKVAAGMNILSKLIGSNITLSAIGSGGSTITKIWGHDGDLSAKAQLGDLCEDDSRLVLVEADVMPPLDYAEGEEGEGKLVDLIKYTWSYKNSHGSIIEAKGSVQTRFTSVQDRIQEVDAVKVTTATSEGSEKDAKILELLNRGERQQALALKKEIISSLEAIEKLDTTGVIAKLLKRHRTTLEEMEQNSNLEELQRNVGYDMYHGQRLECAGLI